MANVVVTGGTGFIGSHVVEQLLARGFHVRCFVRSTRNKLGWIEGLPVEAVKVDLTDAKALRAQLHDIDYVFHIAGTTKVRKKQEYQTGNVDVTRALLEASQAHGGIKKFCHISSLSVVGPSYDGKPFNEQSPYHPINLYGRTKTEAEQLVLKAASTLPVVVLRPPTVYGPRDTDVLELYQWVNRGVMPVLGKEDKKLSMIHVSDLARGIIEATLSEKTAGKTYFISNRPIYFLSEVTKFMANIMGKKAAWVVRMPVFLLFTIAGVTQLASKLSSKPSILSLDKAQEILQPHWICDGDRIQSEIGFESRLSLEEGLRSTYDWYRANGWL